MQIDLDNVNLHDATLVSVEMRCEVLALTLHVMFYPVETLRSRQRASICFEGVSQFSMFSDLAQILDNSKAGNISGWRVGRSGGTTYIYLLEGCIAVTADRVSLQMA